MLVTFVLFGHWMEMKSRRGTTDALRALFDLVPPTATVIRDGQRSSCPPAEIVVGDVVRLRPGDKVPVDGRVDRRLGLDRRSARHRRVVPVEKAGRRGDRRLDQPVRIGGVPGDQDRRRHRARPDRRPGRAGPELEGARPAPRRPGAGVPGGRGGLGRAGHLPVWYFFSATTDFIRALTFAISAVVIACPDALGLATPTAVAVGTGSAPSTTS